MTDDQLITDTAAAISEELFTASDYIGPLKILVKDRYGTVFGKWNKPEFERRIATHLAAMLAKREEKPK